jgi:hypothetical protein
MPIRPTSRQTREVIRVGISLSIDAVVNKAAWRKYRQPLVRLRAALYGHPDSVTWWDEKTHHEAQEAGFVPMCVEWPAMRLHRASRLLLVVHVDASEMAGPSRTIEEGWMFLKQRLDIGAATGPGMRLGCDQSARASKLPNCIDICVTVCKVKAFL